MFVSFVVAALLSCYAGEAWGESESQKILALAGETAILPCNTPISDVHPTVEWSKDGLERGIALLYRDGCETHEEKNPVFRYRTSFIMNELRNGNISLRISKVQLSDTGTYNCKTIRQNIHTDVLVELSVGEVSEPKLSIVPAVGGGVTLQCEATWWFPQPEITFSDDQGNDVSAEEPVVSRDSSGRFKVTRRMTVQNHSNRFTCKVHQTEIKQTRFAKISIPDECMASCTTIIIIAVCLAVALLCALIVIIYKKCFKSVLGQKLPLCHRNHQNSRNGRKELLRKIGELNLRPHEEERIICQLIEKLNDLCQHGQPATDNSPPRSVPKPVTPPPKQTPHPNNPKPVAPTSGSPPKSGNPPQNQDLNPGVPVQNPAPAPSIQRSSHDRSSAASTGNAAQPSSPTSAVAAKEGVIGRSQSVSRPHTNSNKPLRRNTISTFNRYSPLASLREDNEPLLLH